MQKHPANQMLQTQALRGLNTVLLSGALPFAKVDVVKVLEVMAKAMNSFPDHDELQAIACGILAEFIW